MKDDGLIRLRARHLLSVRCTAQTAEHRLENPLFNILVKFHLSDARTPYPIGNRT
jgi:hypothetical protein